MQQSHEDIKCRLHASSHTRTSNAGCKLQAASFKPLLLLLLLLVLVLELTLG